MAQQSTAGEFISGALFGPSVADQFAAPMLTCGCPACAAIAGQKSNGTSPHVRAAAFATVASDHRSYAVLSQTVTPDGNGSFTGSFSGDRNIDAVLIGSKIVSTDLTYTFPTSGTDYGNNYDSGQADRLLPFNEMQQAAARAAFAMVAKYTQLTFREITPAESADDRATFRLAQTTSATVISAMGRFPHSADEALGQNPSGDIWFGRTEQPYYTNPAKGNWGYVTVLHEIGHTLGLKHGGDDYSGFDLADIFGSATPVYGTRALDWAKDGQLWSLMTYSTAPNTRNAYNGDEKNQATSYMMYDIAALQYLYGANYTTNAGDTVYRWDATTGEGFVNGVGQGRPTDNKVLETVWDGGGNDTYDLSNYDGGVSIDLRPGATSVLSAAQLPNAEAYLGYVAPMQGSVANALLYKDDGRSLIENAVGGAGNDILIGNRAANLLVGNAGDDAFDGMEGSDTIIGGAGSDTVSFSTATTGITLALDNGRSDIRVANGGDVDVLRSIENIVGTAHDDTLVGDDGDNMLSGGAGGRDTLRGGDGDDRLVGGGFRLDLPDRPDVVKTAGTVNGSIATAVLLDGSFDLAPRYGVADAATIPHATIVGTVAQDGYEYYGFTGKAGAAVSLDVDLADGTLYPGLLLFDGAGTQIAANYESLKRDEGSNLAADPKIDFVLPADGLYYVAITNSAPARQGFVSTDLPVGFKYVLNVSVEQAAVPAPTLLETGAAYLDGGAGDDMLVTAMGDDTVLGGAGSDTVSFEQSYKGIAVDLRVTDGQDTGAGLDRIAGVENVLGSRQADVIVGDGGDNVIDGFTGDDTLVGGAGTDTLSFARQVQGIRYDLTGQGAAETVRLGEDVTASGFENVRGSAFDDVLAGDAGANVIDGGAGDDRLSGDGLGRTGGGVDTLIGGTGTDLASFAAHAQDITARLDTGTALAGGAVIATLREIENLEGGSGDDALTGDAGANMLSGNAGNDRMSGGAGDDILSGGAGDDVLDGGDGTDMAIYDGAVDVTVDLRLTGAQQTGQGLDTLRGIENLWLGTGNSQVTGDGGANLFRDGGGNDAIDGGSGSDTVDYSRAKAAVTVDLSLTAAQATGSGTDRLTGIENLIGSRFDDQLFGDGGSNRLAGGGGGDFIVGGDGTDTIDGGDGNDILLGDANSIADLGQSGRNDTISGGAGRDVVIGGQGDDVLSGGTGNDYIISGSAKIDADAGGYYLDLTNFADGGNDVIDGGDGVDRATLTFEGRREAVALDLSDSSRVNILYSGGNAVGSVTGIEKVWIFSGSGDDRFVGTAGDDQLRGGAGDDQLIGGLGDDYLVGGSGNDLIDGGEGFDTFDIGYEATGGSRIDLRLTGPQDTGVMGTETIRGIEKIVTSQFTDIIIGGDENLAANDDRGGADSFYGNGGNDTLEVVRYAENETAAPIVIDGGTGNDNLRYSSGLIPGRGTDGLYTRYLDTVTLTGGAGDDFIKSWGARSIVIDAGEGNDVVGIGINGRADQTAFDITLGAGQDELAIQWGGGDIAMYDRSANIVRDFQAGAGGDLLGLTAIVSQGLYDSAGDPAMIGTFSPFLSGHVTLVKQGGDTLLQADMDGRFGPAGWVTVMKLEGTNAFGFTTGNVYAYYVDETGNTQTVVYDPIITQYMAAGETRLDGHAGADSLQGAAGSDLLIGYGGDDFINGFAGNDTLVGGGGRDYLVGGNGDDVYYVDRADDYVQETWDEGTDRVVTSVDWTLDTNFEQIESLDGGLRLTGNYRDNVLYGSRNGADVLVGDYGNDTYVVRHADTTIVEDAYGGNDEVIVATASYTLTQGAMVEMMRAATGSDAIDMTGNEFDQMLVANAGANRLNGGGGIDIVSYRAATAGVVVNGATMTGTGGDATGDRYQNVEGFQGSDFADRLIAGNGGMTLDGRAGDDWLVGGTGNDTLFGGAGSDVFVFNTNGISGRDRVLDWSAGDRIATSKQLRGADSQGLITLGANGLVLLDGVLAGDTAELVDTGGAVLRAMGKQDGYWWYGFVSGGNPAFNGRVVEMASMDALTHAAAAAPANDGIAAHHAGDAGTGGGMSPFYVYDAMGDAMQSGALLNA